MNATNALNAEAMRLAEQPEQDVPTQADIDRQDWARHPGAIAFHLIERHAEDWGHAGRMMEAWRQARSPQPAGMMTVEAHQRIVAEAVAQACADAQRIREERDRLRRIVSICIETIERSDTSDGWCCCGSSMESHGMGDGHSPADQGDYYAAELIERARAALSGAKE